MSPEEHWLYTLYNFSSQAVRAYAFGSSEFILDRRNEIFERMLDEHRQSVKAEWQRKLPPPVMLASKLSTGITTVENVYRRINPKAKIKQSKNYFCVFIPFSKADNEVLFELH
jgi:hypothetical protein